MNVSQRSDREASSTASRAPEIALAITISAITTWLFASSVSGQEVPRMALAAEPVFVSADHSDPHVAQIGRLDGALLIGASQIAFVDGISQILRFVDIATGATWTAQEDGVDVELGPPMRLLDRSAGIIATDRNGSVTVFDADGQPTETTTYDPFALSFTSPAKAVGMFPDGDLLFRRASNAPSGFSLATLTGPKGLQRDTVSYETPNIGGTATVVARALDGEKIFLRTRVDGVSSSGTDPIIFGQKLLATRVGEHVVIVQTDRSIAVIYDRSGTEVAEFPMPGERRQVAAEQVEAQRKTRMRERERENEVNRRARERSYAENFGAVYSPGRDSVRIAQLPANDVAPPVDRVIGDLDGRVWLRLFAMPTDTVVRWRVWRVGHRLPDFEITLPRSLRLLDATEDLLLLETTEGLGAGGLTIQKVG